MGLIGGVLKVRGREGYGDLRTMKFRVKVVGRREGLRSTGTLRDWESDDKHEVIESSGDGLNIMAADDFGGG